MTDRPICAGSPPTDWLTDWMDVVSNARCLHLSENSLGVSPFRIIIICICTNIISYPVYIRTFYRRQAVVQCSLWLWKSITIYGRNIHHFGGRKNKTNPNQSVCWNVEEEKIIIIWMRNVIKCHKRTQSGWDCHKNLNKRSDRISDEKIFSVRYRSATLEGR